MRHPVQRPARWAGLLAVICMLVTACGSGDVTTPTTPSPVDPGRGCSTKVYAAVSPEKVGLFNELARQFYDSEQAKGLAAGCADVIPFPASSGTSAGLLEKGWPTSQTTDPQPSIWSPASSNWTDQVAASGHAALVADPQSFARTPLVIAMPEPMAKAMGWPDAPIGYKTLHDLCLNPEGWGAYGQPLYGKFVLAKTNPTTSTSGLNSLLGQMYAAAGKQNGLTTDDVNAGVQFSQELESCVSHYGDTTGGVLQRLYDRDQSGNATSYISAVAVEETSVVNYNLGNPSGGVVTAGQQLTRPATKLVAVYPTEGSAESNNPLVVLGNEASWVTPEQRTAASAFQKFVLSQAAQSILPSYGFRPLDRKTALGGLITPEYGVDPTKPAITLPNPDSASNVIPTAQAAWDAKIRKPSRVMLLVDMSDSMTSQDAVNPDNQQPISRIQAAIYAAQKQLGRFRPTDELGVWLFGAGYQSNVDPPVDGVREYVPVAAGARENLSDQIGDLADKTQSGTPLYDALAAAYSNMDANKETGRINAIILLSDGGDNASSLTEQDVLNLVSKANSGETIDPAAVRVFPIVFSEDANKETLDKIAVASGGQLFNASDPRRLDLVFGQAIRNF